MGFNSAFKGLRAVFVFQISATNINTEKIVLYDKSLLFFLWRCDPTRVMASSFTRFLDHTQRCTTVGMTPLDELSARRRYLYLTTHDTHNRQTSIPPGGIRTQDLSRRAAADLCLRPRGHWDRQCASACTIIVYVFDCSMGKEKTTLTL